MPPATLAEMQAIIEQLNTRIQQLEAEGGVAQTLVNELSKKEGGSKAKLDAPAKYGGDKEALTGFLTQARAYLQYYPEKFRDEAAKVIFVSSRLEGKALRWFEPSLKDQLTDEEENQDEFTKKVFKKYDAFEEEITKVFGDTDEKLHAQERLARLRQTKSAAAYATIFRQDSLRAEFNDEGLMQLFYDGLKEEVKDELYKNDRPETLDEYIAMAIRIDDRQYSRKQQRKGQGGNRPFAQVQANSGKKRHVRYAVHGTHAGPMDTSAVQRGPGPVKKDKTDVTCFNCGKKGHFKRECRGPKKDGWKPAPGRETATIDKHARVVECSMVNSEYYKDDFGPEHDTDLPQDEVSIPDTADAEEYDREAECQDREGPFDGADSDPGAKSVRNKMATKEEIFQLNNAVDITREGPDDHNVEDPHPAAVRKPADRYWYACQGKSTKPSWDEYWEKNAFQHHHQALGNGSGLFEGPEQH